jgi:Fe-S cluster assembly iron-binding protein IscA
MLAVTNQAAAAIDDILSSRELPEEAGVRITTQVDLSGNGTAEPKLQLEVVDAPESGDQVLDEAPVFVEPEAAAMLEDKLLDADVAGEERRFALKQQD